jgi:hypothetical protein
MSGNWRTSPGEALRALEQVKMLNQQVGEEGF